MPPTVPTPPPNATQLLVPTDVLSEATTRSPQDLVAWHGVVWSRLGRGDLAFAWWDRVTDPVLQPWLQAERGRIVRELGLHADAEQFDQAGAGKAIDLADRVMLAVGLVADAVGQGDESGAVGRLAAATTLSGQLNPEQPRHARQLIRLSWVSAEVAWMTGQPVDVLSLPHRNASGQLQSLPIYQAGTTFHRAKGLLFGAIASDDDWLLQSAAGIAPPVLRWAILLARHDRGIANQAAAVALAWRDIIPPPEFAEQAGATGTAMRIAALELASDSPDS